MKQTAILLGLGAVLSGIIMGFIVPNVNTANNEVLERSYTITERNTPSIETPNATHERQAPLPPNDSLKTPKASASKQKPGKRVTKKEKMELDALIYSRAIQFRPEEELVTDSLPSDTIIN